MKTIITKPELVRAVAAMTQESRDLVKTVLEVFLAEVQKALARGDSVELRGFGVWHPHLTPPRIGQKLVDGRTLGQVTIPPRPAVRFRMGKDLRQALTDGLKPNAPQRATGVLIAEPVVVVGAPCEEL
jgi:integration host factor subunit beta